MPDELTDNGKVFTNRFGLTPSEVLFDKICRRIEDFSVKFETWLGGGALSSPL